MVVVNMDTIRGQLLYTLVLERLILSCHSICHMQATKAGHENVRLMIQSDSTSESVSPVHSQYTLQQWRLHISSCATHTRRREAGHTIRQSIGLKCTSIKINCLIASEMHKHTTQYIVQMVCVLLTKLQDRCISQLGVIII